MTRPESSASTPTAAELDADPANRVIPEVRTVLERTRVLRDHVERNIDVPADVQPALGSSMLWRSTA